MSAASLILLIYSLAAAASPLTAAGPEAGAAEGGAEARPWNPEVAARALSIFKELAPPAVHYAGLSEAEADRLLRSDAAYRQLTRERLEGRWFAALVATEGADPDSIRARFDTWQGLVEFLAGQNALVEVWACG